MWIQTRTHSHTERERDERFDISGFLQVGTANDTHINFAITNEERNKVLYAIYCQLDESRGLCAQARL